MGMLGVHRNRKPKGYFGTSEMERWIKVCAAKPDVLS